MQKLLVILGPNATGKTDLGLLLAKKFNGEIVSCDSRQVYVGLDIGTGKMPLRQAQGRRVKKGKGFWEINGVKIWMYDVVSPKIQHTVYDYVKGANKVIDNIGKRGKLSIVVGGTGLYLKALLDGLPNLEIPIDLTLRKKLEKLSKYKLQKKLQEISPWWWNSLNKSDRENPRRLIRAIELTTQTQSRLPRPAFGGARNATLKVGLTASREILYQRVDKHVVSRIKEGMIDEAKNLHKKGLSFKRMRQLGLKYGVLADYLSGKIRNCDELIKIMQTTIHGYVRRQLTWFKKETNVVWFDITDEDYTAKVEDLVTKWYDSVDVTTKN